MDLKTFQCYTAEAPDLLEQIAQLLQECREKEILLPKGIRNLCALSWEELSDIPADAKPFHQTRVSGRPPRPYPTQVALTPDTRYRMSIVTSQILLPTESSLSVRQPNARFSTLKFKKKFPVDRDNNSEKQISTCIPVTSTLRLCLEECLSHLSFSLTYKEVNNVPCTPRLHSRTLEVCYWAVNKLRPILEQIKEENARLDLRGHIRPMVAQHYQDYKVLQLPQPVPAHAEDCLFPLIPDTKYLSYSISPKLHYGLPDGTSYLYYPSGSVAVCQLPSAMPGGGVYTNIFSDSPYDILVASFKPSGHGVVYHTGKHRSSWVALLVGSLGGQQYTREGCLTKEWTFNPRSQNEVLHKYKVNENITLTFSNHLNMTLIFSVLAENDITLSLREEEPPVSSGREGPGAAVVESVEVEAYRAELQGIRKRVRDTALRWLQLYLMATGLSDEPLLPPYKFRPPKRKEAWTATPRVPLTVEEIPPTFVRPARLRRKVPRPATRSLPMSTPANLFRPTLHRAKSAGLPCISSLSALSPSETPPCPVVLRLLLLHSSQTPPTPQGCHCSTRLPLLSDLELELFLRAPWAPRGHILVIYVTSSLCPPPRARNVEVILRRVHHRQVHASANPCAKSSQDPFRLVKYDTDTATRLTQSSLPVLVKRHGIGPGTLLMYAGGKLIFGGSALNGYGFSKTNLLKQIAKTQSDYAKGNFLPHDYKLGSQGWEAKCPPQTEPAGRSKEDGQMEDRPLRSRSTCSHYKENRFPDKLLSRSLGGTALDFVVSSMSDRVCILAMQSKRLSIARPATTA
eukprot:XP_014022485.1 PREDICTED: uncharacterized protein C3orf20-like [Salmo salar]